jgi:hypothetical protein
MPTPDPFALAMANLSDAGADIANAGVDLKEAVRNLGRANRTKLGKGRSSHAELRMAIEVIDAQWKAFDAQRAVIERVYNRLNERQ